MQRPVVVPRSLLPSVTTRRTRMGLIGSDTRLLVVTWSKLPAERPVSRMSRPVVLLSLVRAPAQPPQHAYFGSRSHTPSNRCLRFERRVTATPARLAPVLLARLWTDQTCTGKLASASPIAPRSPAFRLASSRGTRRWPKVHASKAQHAERSEDLIVGEPLCAAPLHL